MISLNIIYNIVVVLYNKTTAATAGRKRDTNTTHTHTQREIERVVGRLKNIYYNHIFHYVTTLGFCSVYILSYIIYLYYSGTDTQL